MKEFIELKDVSFAYKINGLESLTAVDHAFSYKFRPFIAFSTHFRYVKAL